MSISGVILSCCLSMTKEVKYQLKILHVKFQLKALNFMLHKFVPAGIIYMSETLIRPFFKIYSITLHENKILNFCH